MATDAVLTMPAPGAAGSLGENKAIVIDANDPTVALTPPLANVNSAYTVTAQFSETVTGFAVGDIVVVNGTKSNFTAVDGDTYTFDITPTIDGIVTVNIAAGVAQDAGLNDNAAASQLSTTYDSTDPTVALSTPLANVNGVYTVTAQFSETVTGFVVGDIVVVNGTAGNFVAVDGDTYTFDITPTVDGVVTVDIAAAVAQDAATNDNTAATQLVTTFDSTLPAITLSTPDSTINGLYTVTAQFSKNVTGFVIGDIVVVNGTKSNFVAVDGDTYTFDITPTAEGAVTVDVAAGVAQDIAANLNTIATQLSTTYDATAPTVTLSTPDATVNVPFTVTAQFSEDVFNFIISDITVGNGTAGNFVAVDGDTYTFDITPTADGNVTVDIDINKAEDASENGNTAATQLVTLYDATAPVA